MLSDREHTDMSMSHRMGFSSFPEDVEAPRGLTRNALWAWDLGFRLARHLRMNGVPLLMLLLFAGILSAQPATVTVTDTLRLANSGGFCGGTINVSWTTFYSTDGFRIQGGNFPVTVNPATGVFSIALVPTNVTATPAQGYYSIRYDLRPTICASATSTWKVPLTGPTNLLGVESVSVPPPPSIPVNSLATPAIPGTYGLCFLNGIVQWSTSCAGSGGGGVSSVGLALPNIFSVSGSPVTTSGTLTGTLATQAANRVFAGPTTGSAAVPTFRALVAADMPGSVPTSVVNDTNVTGSITTNVMTLGWTGTLAAGRLNANVVQAITNDTNVTGSISAQNLTLAWSGTLAVARGGIGVGTLTGVAKGNGTSAFTAAAAADIVGLFSTCSGTLYLGADGACHAAGTGSVTTFSAGNLSPLFTTSVATATTTPALTFALSNAAGHTFFGNNTGSTAAPAFSAIGFADVTITAANIVSLFTGCSGTQYLGADGACHTAGGSGTVTSIATTSPITGGTITSTGTIACATCVTSAAALTNHAITLGQGGQAVAALGSLGTTTTVLHGNAAGDPSFGAVANADLTNSSLTVSPGTCLSGGGSISLGGSATVNVIANCNTRGIGAGFDNSGTALTSGSTQTVYFTVPFSCTISAWNITVDTGTITFDVWKIATGTAIPTVANTITASALPAISSGTALHSTTLTGWTTSVSANDIFGININTVATATKASLVLQCNVS